MRNFCLIRDLNTTRSICWKLMTEIAVSCDKNSPTLTRLLLTRRVKRLTLRVATLPKISRSTFSKAEKIPIVDTCMQITIRYVNYAKKMILQVHPCREFTKSIRLLEGYARLPVIFPSSIPFISRVCIFIWKGNATGRFQLHELSTRKFP